MGTVTVVGFTLNDTEKDNQLPRPLKTTREKQASIEGGAVELPGTEQTVEEGALEDSFYHPRP